MARRPRKEDQWYYCLSHKQVEPWEACRAEVRLGPYLTRADAEAALERIEERNEEWETDPIWNDPLPDEEDDIWPDGSPRERHRDD